MIKTRLFLLALFCVAAAHGGWHNVVSRAYVADVTADGEGVWLTFLGGGAARFEPTTGSIQYLTTAEGLIHNYVTAVAADGGDAWFATRNGVCRRTGNTFKSFVRTWGYAHNDCTDVAVDAAWVYVATVEGARRYDRAAKEPVFEEIPASEGPASKLSPQINDGWRVYVNADECVLDDLYSVSAAGDAVYWGGRGRLFATDAGASRWRELPVALPAVPVRRVLYHDGDLLIATDAGAFVSDGESTVRLEGALGHASVRDVVAFAGFVYFATAEGLFVKRYDGTPFKTAAGSGERWDKVKKSRDRPSPTWRWSVGDGLPDPRCTSLAVWEESIIIGTEYGAAILEPSSGQFRAIPIPRGLPAGGVYALAVAENRLAAATRAGVWFIDDDLSPERKPLPGRWGVVRDVASQGEITAVATKAGIGVSRTGKPRQYWDLKAHGVRGEGRAVAITDDGFFLGTDHGVLAFDQDLVNTGSYGEPEGVPDAPVRALLPLGDKLLAATQGGGLAVIDVTRGAATVLSAPDGVSGDVIFSLAADANRVFVGTFDKGVDVLGSDLKRQRNLSWGDGLNHTDIWSAAAVDNWLWLAIRGVGINAVDLSAPADQPVVRRYYARYGLGDEYCKSVRVWNRNGTKRLAFGTLSGVAVLDYEGDPPDFGAGDFDAAYP